MCLIIAIKNIMVFNHLRHLNIRAFKGTKELRKRIKHWILTIMEEFLKILHQERLMSTFISQLTIWEKEIQLIIKTQIFRQMVEVHP
jgi:hypothetical protein